MTNFYHNGGSSQEHVPIARATLAPINAPIATGMRVTLEDHNRRNSEYSQGSVLTHMHGPSGTRGRDARSLDRYQIDELIEQGYSRGLIKALSENAYSYDFRFWIIDNSGSMQIGDGHRIVPTGKTDGSMKAVASTRWEELKETVQYHAKMSALMDSPTIFKVRFALLDPLITRSCEISRLADKIRMCVCEHGREYTKSEIENVVNTMTKIKPGGVTPLTEHIYEIQEQVSAMAEDLREGGKQVAIILATDGLPTNKQGYGGKEVMNEFVSALRSLEGLPVWLVIRLCTDEDDVCEFYNSLDAQLELSLEVLDDFMGEASEVYRMNPWLCYGLPIHRCRELGYHDRLFDLLDERPLTRGEARSFCCLMLGIENELDLPDPAIYLKEFIKAVDERLLGERKQWNPVKKKMTPWINTKSLKRSLSENKCIIL
ncbi:hypothetical protein ACHAWO_000923 [Cyclotella atomus]|uniref:VWFA domain-containing protein n=1 Tax=Cyclotella atomus TaxID=382360 RepID=A0ABD3NPB2_9STRA